MSDMVLLVPELILAGTALILILAARRIQKTPVAAVATVMAAAAAAVGSRWLLDGGSRTGFDGMLVVDGYSQFFKVVIAAALALVALLSVGSIEEHHLPRVEYHSLLLLAATGMMLAVSAHDLLPLFLGLEVMSLCSYILVGIQVDNPASNEAAIKYFLLGLFASALLIYGISLTYGVTRTTDFAAIAAALSAHSLNGNPILPAAVGLVAAGLSFKIAAVPLHAWAPDAYQGAAAPVAAFLASGSKAVGLAALGRVCLTVYGSESHALSVILATLAALSIVAGSIVALSQVDMKRLLAYSSITHAGYALLGLVAGNAQGALATMNYAFIYVFMTLGAFGVVIALGKRGEQLDGYRGLAAQRPVTAFLMLLFLMSLTGIPPTAGFTAKFLVILSLVRGGRMALAILAVACSVLSAFFYMRVAVFMYMTAPQEPAPARCPAPVAAALAAAAVATLTLGIFPGGLAAWAVSP
jgi:NADH-quinone oxidoreductase subunit N